MKRCLVFMLCLMLMCTAFMYSCDKGDVEESAALSGETPSEADTSSAEGSQAEIEHVSGTAVVNNIEELRALTVDEPDVTVTLLGYYEPGDGGQGIF